MLTAAKQKNTQSDAKVTVLTETKYMQQYRLRSELYGSYADIVAVCNASEEMEFFITYSGKVWNYYPNPSQAAKYGVTELKFNLGNGIRAPIRLAVDTDAQGKVIVFAAHANHLQCIHETSEAGAKRWGEASDIPLFKKSNDSEPPSASKTISDLYTRNIDNALYIGVLVEAKNDPLLFQFGYSQWDGTSSSELSGFTWTADLLPSQKCVWSGTTKETAAFTMLRDDYRAYSIAEKTWITHPLSHKEEAESVATAGGEYFAVDAEGELGVLRKDKGGANHYNWHALSQGPYASVQASTDATGAINLFALDVNRTLIHCKRATPEADWSSPAIVTANVSVMSVARDKKGDIHVFVLDEDQRTFRHLTYIAATGEIQTLPISTPVDTSDKIEEFFAYSTDVTVKDHLGVPIPKAEIRITSSAPTQITVNSQICMVDDTFPAIVWTDAAGTLTIVQPARTLGASALKLHVPDLTQTAFALRPWEAAVLGKLASVTTGEALGKAKLDNGSYLLPDEYRQNPDQAEELAKTIAKCVQLMKNPVVTMAAGQEIAQGQYHAGFGAVTPGSAARLGRITIPADFAPWHIDFGSRRPQDQHALPGGTMLAAADPEKWVGNLEDLIQAIGNDSFHVTGVGMAPSNSRSFGDTVLNILLELPAVRIGRAVASFVVKTASDVLQAIAALFAGAGIALTHAKEWLAFVFDWNDILRTKKALVHAIDQILTFSEYSVDKVTAAVDQQFTTWHKDMDQGFKNLESQVQGSFGDFFDKKAPPKDPKVSEAVSNNFVYRSLMDNEKDSTSSVFPEADKEKVTEIKTIMQNFEKQEEIKGINILVKSTLSDVESADNAYNLGLSKLFEFLRQVASGVLKGTQKMAAALMKLIASTLKGLRDLLNAKWEIPFVSAFYLKISGDELTAKDLIALLIAIPATAAWKVLRNTPIFKDDAELAEFKNGCTWKNMMEFLPGADSSAVKGRAARASGWSTFIAKWGSFLSGVAGYASGIGIVISAIGALTESLSDRLLGVIGLACGLIGLLGFPTGPSTFATWALSILWIWADFISIVNFGVLFLNAVTASDRVGALLGTGFGIIFLLLAAKALTDNEVEGIADVLLSICGPIAIACAFFNWPAIKVVLTKPIADAITSAIAAITASTSMACANLIYTAPAR